MNFYSYTVSFARITVIHSNEEPEIMTWILTDSDAPAKKPKPKPSGSTLIPSSTPLYQSVGDQDIVMNADGTMSNHGSVGRVM